MPDYLTLRRTTSNSNSGFWINGVTLYTVPNAFNTQYRCAYSSESEHEIRVGVYRAFDRYNFVFVSEEEIIPVDIRLVYTNTYDETIVLKTIDRISTEFSGGYRNGLAVAPDNPSTALTVFSSLNECLEAIGFYESTSADIIVTIKATDNISPEIVVDVAGTAEGAKQIVVTIEGKRTPNNPYSPGGDSEPGGGGGTFDNPTDPISLPDLPSHGVTDFLKLWNPSDADMVRLAELLFTGNIFTQAIRDLIGQPINYIVSLGIVPVPLSIGSISTEFHIAHQNAGFNMYGVAQQYMRWPCGSVLVPLYWNSFLDFEPHTSIQLFLPFIGFRDINPSDVVGKTIYVTYHIDVFSGACVAYVMNEQTVLYQFNGSCLSPIPFAAEQMQNLVSGFVGLLGAAGTAAAVLTGGFASGIAKSILAGTAIGGASSVLSMPEHKIEHGGAVGSTAGLLASRKPYFVLNRPRQAVAENQGIYSGYATWYTVDSMGTLQGYTEVAECHLHDIPATDWELQEIERLLKEGVIF